MSVLASVIQNNGDYENRGRVRDRKIRSMRRRKRRRDFGRLKEQLRENEEE
jgi:hypothetical protein